MYSVQVPNTEQRGRMTRRTAENDIFDRTPSLLSKVDGNDLVTDDE